jgi:uncharacterized protein (TIGR02996 family)
VTIWESDSWQSFARGIAAHPNDDLPKLIAGDWLQDHGADNFGPAELFEPPAFVDLLPSWYYGRGIGSGIGSGSGRGRGSGRGIGSGIGSGSGRGIGIGSGIGSGSGSGSGIGSESGRGSGIGSGEITMQAGKCYMILAVDWYAYVGRCVRQVGPYEYEMELVSKFDTNSGDTFFQIAAGDKSLRNRCTYQHYPDTPGEYPIIGLGSVGKFPWVGKLPQEEGYPG